MSNSVLDLYDHEVKEILDLLAELNLRATVKKHNYNDFEREIKGRFGSLGFTVDVNWYTYAIGDAPQEGAMPEITITGRAEKHAFDPDRQVHEAVHDVLGLGEEGWIKTSPEAVRRFLDGQGGHGHDRH